MVEGKGPRGESDKRWCVDVIVCPHRPSEKDTKILSPETGKTTEGTETER